MGFTFSPFTVKEQAPKVPSLTDSPTPPCHCPNKLEEASPPFQSSGPEECSLKPGCLLGAGPELEEESPMDLKKGGQPSALALS